MAKLFPQFTRLIQRRQSKTVERGHRKELPSGPSGSMAITVRFDHWKDRLTGHVILNRLIIAQKGPCVQNGPDAIEGTIRMQSAGVTPVDRHVMDFTSIYECLT